jgi:hypothetical protein
MITAVRVENPGWLIEVRARRPGSVAPRVQQTCVVEYAERLQRERQQGQEGDS